MVAGCSGDDDAGQSGDTEREGDESNGHALAARYGVGDITFPSGIGLDYFHETKPRNTGVEVPAMTVPPNDDQIEAVYATPGSGFPELIVNLTDRPGEDATRLIDGDDGVSVRVADDILCAPGSSDGTFECAVQLEDGVISVRSDATLASLDGQQLPTSAEEMGALTIEFLRLATEGEPAPTPETLSDLSAATVELPEDPGPAYSVVESALIEAPPDATTHAAYTINGPAFWEVGVFPGVTADAVKADLRDVQLMRRVECGLNATNGLAVCVVPLSDGVLVVNDSEMALKDPDASSRFTAALLYALRHAAS